ncbi:hypothetical protein AUJ68_03195 [Candidatus Woesearchaeota archaeon CG1_02_57_44]|nr:MAG: hypothetical protein AUJ68_03195 [Candidatus Woesearchaeota archaeon CG1_02_57_44]PIN68228.1 MAG: hypothetical protein COV94_05845 [Candidatus Woesearchaeota archaeon CG11_big_fil_rev_8_21_14_0_20_57_5]
MDNKGQAAMEFLMTYGWAIIVVLAAIGALAYFGVLSPTTILPQRTTFPSPLPNIDVASVSALSDSVEVAFTNNVGYTIDVISAGAAATDDCGGTVALENPPTNVVNGAKFKVNWSCGGGVTAGKFKSDLTFSYTNDYTNQTHQHSGSVAGNAVSS